MKTPMKTTSNISGKADIKPKHFKLSIDLVSVKVMKGDLHGQDGVLAYKYPALHKEAIKKLKRKESGRGH